MGAERIEDLAAICKPLGAFTSRRMFGGVGLYLDGVFFALIAAGELYFKVDDETRPAYERAGSEPFRPYPDKEGSMMSYFRVPLEVEEDPRALRAWAAEALAAARRRDAAKGGKRRKAKSGERAKGARAQQAKPAGDASGDTAVRRLRNLGPKSAAWLAAVGVHTRRDLERLGSVAAYARVLADGVAPSLNLLYALESALLDVRWDELPPPLKADLRAAVERGRAAQRKRPRRG